MSMNVRSEKGASAVIIAGSLVMLMGIAAIALDGGQTFSERRQAQNATDFAVMAALLGATTCPGSCTTSAAADAGALEAIAVTDENLPGRALDWAACTDPARPGKFTIVSGTTNCVSYTANFDEARVVIPDDVIDTAFGGVVGRNTITIGAFAEAGQESEASAAVVPFAFAGGTLTCLFSNQAPQTVAPCDGPNNGNFGYLDITQYGNDTFTPPTPTNCGNGGALTRMAWNIALGTDHILGIRTSTGAIVNDRDACPNLSETPNQIETQIGSPSGAITSGLVTLNSPQGRLRCQGGSCRTVRTYSLNDTPLWSFLTGSHGCGSVTNRAQMQACLGSWNPGKGVIFSASIANNRRFAAVPRFNAYPSGGFGLYEIRSFVPVYLDTIYIGCNASRCDTVFSPGAGAPAASCPNPLTAATTSCGHSGSWGGGVRIEGLTAFTLDIRMLPASVTENFPGSVGLRVLNLTE